MLHIAMAHMHQLNAFRTQIRFVNEYLFDKAAPEIVIHVHFRSLHSVVYASYRYYLQFGDHGSVKVLNSPCLKHFIVYLKFRATEGKGTCTCTHVRV